MKSKWIVSMVAVLGVLVAVAAFAAEAAKKAAPEAQKQVVRVEVEGDEAGGPWTWQEADDDFDLYAFGDEGDAGGGDGQRIVIRERMGPGMGMGMGPGMGRGRGMHRAMGHRLMAAFERLDLTDAQRTKLADVREKQQRKAIQARADLEIAQLDLHKAMKAETPTATSINTQIDKVSKLRADMQKSQVAAFLEARALLTPEQQKQLREGAMRGPGQHMMMHGKPPGGEGDPD